MASKAVLEVRILLVEGEEKVKDNLGVFYEVYLEIMFITPGYILLAWPQPQLIVVLLPNYKRDWDI